MRLPHRRFWQAFMCLQTGFFSVITLFRSVFNITVSLNIGVVQKLSGVVDSVRLSQGGL